MIFVLRPYITNTSQVTSLLRLTVSSRRHSAKRDIRGTDPCALALPWLGMQSEDRTSTGRTQSLIIGRVTYRIEVNLSDESSHNSLSPKVSESGTCRLLSPRPSDHDLTTMVRRHGAYTVVSSTELGPGPASSCRSVLLAPRSTPTHVIGRRHQVPAAQKAISDGVRFQTTSA